MPTQAGRAFNSRFLSQSPVDFHHTIGFTFDFFFLLSADDEEKYTAERIFGGGELHIGFLLVFGGNLVPVLDLCARFLEATIVSSDICTTATCFSPFLYLISSLATTVTMSTAIAMAPSPAPHERSTFSTDRPAPTSSSTSPPAQRNAVLSQPRTQLPGTAAAPPSGNGSPKSDNAAAGKSSPNA